MNHLGTKTIETQRLYLRRFQVEDAPYMYQNWASDSEVTKYLMWQPHESEEATREYLEMMVENYEKEQDTYDWMIELKSIGQPIGTIGAVRFDPDISLAHIGYCIGKKWWHQGITSEALIAVIHYFQDKVGVNRIESRHDPRNVNSGKVMMKCGMEYEGTLRQSDINNMGICDTAWYAILKNKA